MRRSWSSISGGSRSGCYASPALRPSTVVPNTVSTRCHSSASTTVGRDTTSQSSRASTWPARWSLGSHPRAGSHRLQSAFPPSPWNGLFDLNRILVCRAECRTGIDDGRLGSDTPSDRNRGGAKPSKIMPHQYHPTWLLTCTMTRAAERRGPRVHHVARPLLHSPKLLGDETRRCRADVVTRLRPGRYPTGGDSLLAAPGAGA